MKPCIFCLSDTSASRSVEHIVPESLGNTQFVLPPGIVCDNCNNYFATKVEKPFLETEAIRRLRFQQEIPNKRGRVPPAEAVLLPGFPATLTRFPRSANLGMAMDLSAEGIRYLLRHEGPAKVVLPLDVQDPDRRVVSRFVAKTALEALAHRNAKFAEGIESLATDPQLNLIRDHARRGVPVDWPVHVRRLYAPDSAVLGTEGKLEQVVHEFDILVTSWNELFFILCIFGLELAINYGGPEIEGYHRWLLENGGRSPLYSGRNSGPLPSKPAR